MAPFKNLAGQRFGRLVAMEIAWRRNRKTMWRCQCDCGTTCTIWQGNLPNGTTRSCGCLYREKIGALNRTHGESMGSHSPGSREYRAWRSMKERCLNPNHKDWRYYGGRGISICHRWTSSFQDFLLDMGRCPEGLTLDRIDGNRNYEPGNCRWVDWHTQRTNRATR